jgi:hypothetical protein
MSAAAVTEMVDVEAGKASAAAGAAASSPPNAGANHLPPEPATGRGFLKPVPETTPLERAAGVVAAAAVATALVAMVVEQSAVVIVGGILSCVVGPYCYYQQTRLTDVRTLLETRDALRGEVDRLEGENQKLVANIDGMTNSVDRLEEIDQALTVITQTQGQSVEAFEKQVQENKKILHDMKANVKASVLQNLLSVILRSDKDGDMTIGEAEIRDLVRRIQNLAGVTVHEDRFRRAIEGQSVQAVLEIVKNLLRDDVPEEERIFDIQQQQQSPSSSSR